MISRDKSGFHAAEMGFFRSVIEITRQDIRLEMMIL
jgi:hypothetical protein